MSGDRAPLREYRGVQRLEPPHLFLADLCITRRVLPKARPRRFESIRSGHHPHVVFALCMCQFKLHARSHDVTLNPERLDHQWEVLRMDVIVLYEQLHSSGG